MNFPRPALAALRNANWEVFSVAEECPGISDEEVGRSFFGETASSADLRQGFRRACFPPGAFSGKWSRPVPVHSRISRRSGGRRRGTASVSARSTLEVFRYHT